MESRKEVGSRVVLAHETRTKSHVISQFAIVRFEAWREVFLEDRKTGLARLFKAG